MKRLSTHWWLYLFLFIIAIIFVVPYNIVIDSENSVWNIFCNFGYGVFGSLIVALLIDLDNTSAKKKNDIEKLHIISAEYRAAFLDIRDCVLNVSESRYGKDEKKRSFNDWIDYVMAPIDRQQGETDQDMFDYVFEIQFSIKKIEKAAVTFQDLLLLNLDNKSITNEYRQNIKSVRSISSHIYRLLENGDYVHARKTLKEHLIPKFLKDNEEYIRYFDDPYSEDRYNED